MLRVCQKGEVRDGRALTPEEDHALRAAFGRNADPSARPAGAAVVRRYQHAGPGHWFACSCRGPGVLPPVLVPVAETHIRRHEDLQWPAHNEDCDFHRDPAEQRLVTASYARPARGDAFRLVGKFGGAEPSEPVVLRGRSYNRRRGALATLLAELLVRAGLDRVAPDAPLPSLAEAFRAVRAAAREIPLEGDVVLAEFLCTYPPALPELLAKVHDASPARFRRTRRPHGVLLALVSDASEGRLHLLRGGEVIAVRGPIAIFGEQDGHSRDHATSLRARAPYLALCLVGRDEPNSPATVLKAYLHPCASSHHLMPVDSDLERRTLSQLLRLQAWLTRERGVHTSIEKPLFDVGQAAAPDGFASVSESGCPEESVAAREPCLPDFLLWTRPAPASGRECVIVETMGTVEPAYRERKARTHEVMRKAMHGTPLIQHDFHLPAGQSQTERDRRFWLECRWTVTGPGCQVILDRKTGAIRIEYCP